MDSQSEDDSSVDTDVKIVKEFFDQINFYLKENYSENELVIKSIKKLLNNSINFIDTLNFYTTEIIEMFIGREFKRSEKNDGNNVNIHNLKQNYIQKIHNQIVNVRNFNRFRKDEELIESNIGCTLTLYNIGIDNDARLGFEKILSRLKLKKSFDKIMLKRERNCLKERFKFIKSKGGELIIIPDEFGREYKYMLRNNTSQHFQLKCAGKNCKALMNLFKYSFRFEYILNHNIPFEKH